MSQPHYFIHSLYISESACNEPSYAAPAIAGRYVRLFYKPTPWVDDVTWTVYLGTTKNISYNKTKENGMHIFDLKTFSNSKYITAYISEPSSCRTAFIVNLEGKYNVDLYVTGV